MAQDIPEQKSAPPPSKPSEPPHRHPETLQGFLDNPRYRLDGIELEDGTFFPVAPPKEPSPPPPDPFEGCEQRHGDRAKAISDRPLK